MYDGLRGFLESIQAPHLLVKFPVWFNVIFTDENTGVVMVSIFMGIAVTSLLINSKVI